MSIPHQVCSSVIVPCLNMDCACRASQPAQAQAQPRPEGPAYSSASLGQKPVSVPAVPKPKANKSRAQLEGEERKRGPAGRTSMYKVHSLIFCPCCIATLTGALHCFVGHPTWTLAGLSLSVRSCFVLTSPACDETLLKLGCLGQLSRLGCI